jgi:predicted protein tyrosine phosphatase
MPSEIEDGLFLGNQTDAKDASGYDLVINCTTDIPFAAHVHESARLRVPVKDCNEQREQFTFVDNLISTNLIARMDGILKKDGKVLVHSFMGQQRSCAVVAAYLMYKKHWDMYTALAYIKTKRPYFEHYINFFVALNMLDMHFKKLR